MGDHLRKLLLTGGYTGYAPIASGTFGTLPGVVVAIVVGVVVPPGAIWLVLLGLAGALLAFALTQTAFVRRTWPGEDPGVITLDEVVGYLIALGLLALIVGPPGQWAHVLGFVAFRVFDVLKVPPADRLEELPGALGIMADDVMAGVYTGLVLVGAAGLGFLQ